MGATDWAGRVSRDTGGTETLSSLRPRTRELNGLTGCREGRSPPVGAGSRGNGLGRCAGAVGPRTGHPPPARGVLSGEAGPPGLSREAGTTQLPAATTGPSQGLAQLAPPEPAPPERPRRCPRLRNDGSKALTRHTGGLKCRRGRAAPSPPERRTLSFPRSSPA